MPDSKTDSKSILAMQSKQPHAAPAGGFEIPGPVVARELLSELNQTLNATGVVSVTKAGRFLRLKRRPAAVTDAQIQSIIAAHKPSAPAEQILTTIAGWGKLTASEKDAAILTALRKLYGVTAP